MRCRGPPVSSPRPLIAPATGLVRWVDPTPECTLSFALSVCSVQIFVCPGSSRVPPPDTYPLTFIWGASTSLFLALRGSRFPARTSRLLAGSALLQGHPPPRPSRRGAALDTQGWMRVCSLPREATASRRSQRVSRAVDMHPRTCVWTLVSTGEPPTFIGV